MSEGRLLCIDLQTDVARGIMPEPTAIFGARALLSMARRLGWTVAHTRMRGLSVGDEIREARVSGLRPLMTERVFLRSTHAVTESAGLMAQLEEWRGETVYLAAFDPVSLLSCLLACYDGGPRMVLVENALSASASAASRTARDSFRSTAGHLAAGSTTISGLLAHARPRVVPLHHPA